ncbi:F-box/kelch-repeat protein At3g24760 [Syzygium oleosum]|uniref:F-box/kelch-repeat protein At3g24760 n=1 Tax=Syzygium oleosum TaxID=219896 RepID=UPI0011D2A207|nr:F-box/kelch-repeat protein At3g24760 [Syzygium oleosum]
MSDSPPSLTTINSLSTDLVDLILSLLPVPSLLRASSVCKLWRSIIVSSSNRPRPSPDSPASAPCWFFLYGIHNTSSRNNQSFAFDPLSGAWFRLPIHTHRDDPSFSFTASSGFLFTTTPTFSFTRVFRDSWRATSPLHFSRINPLLAVFGGGDGDGPGPGLRFVVVGGDGFIGNLVDIEDRLAVEIYDPRSDRWDLCPPLPADFRPGNSSQSLSSALFRGRFYVFGIYSCFLSCFDLRHRIWSDVQTLRPPGVLFSFLIACRERLVLAGMCVGPSGPSFNLWQIDETSMEFREIAIMPSNLLNGLVDSEEEDKFASLKCVGSGDMIYVFNEEYHKKYPACVCEIGSDYGRCSWRRLPDLPSPVNKFHKVISFCSAVSIHTVLQGEADEAA